MTVLSGLRSRHVCHNSLQFFEKLISVLALGPGSFRPRSGLQIQGIMPGANRQRHVRPRQSYGDTVVRLTAFPGGTLNVVDAFTPFNQDMLSRTDRDLASGGTLLLPDQGGAHPHVLVTAGKEDRVPDRSRQHGPVSALRHRM